MKYFGLKLITLIVLSFTCTRLNAQSWDLCVDGSSCSDFTLQNCTETVNFTIENISEDFASDGLWTYMYFDLYESDEYLETFTITESIPQAIGSIASFTASNISSGVYYVIVRIETDGIPPTERGYSENIELIGTPPNSTSNFGLLTNFRDLDLNSYRGYINNNQQPGIGNTNLYNCVANEGIADLISADIAGDGQEEIILATNGSYGCQIRYKQSINSQWITLYGPIAGNSITCLDAGQLDLDIKDELLFGLLDNTTTEASAHYISSVTSSPSSFYGPNSFQIVSTIATGDLDNNGKDEIYVGFNSDNQEASVWKKTNINSSWTQIYLANSTWNIATLYTGDPDDDGADQLYWGFNKNSVGGCVIYYNDGSSGNFVTVYPYDDKWVIKDITGGKVNPNSTEDIYFSFLGNNQFARGTVT